LPSSSPSGGSGGVSISDKSASHIFRDAPGHLPEEEIKMDRLTEQQAFEAMKLFIESFYERTKSDDMGGLLGDLILLEDGKTADLAAWDDWMKCVHKVLNK